jgi:K(+)-stimulated pyrophosphate-energized sodium pump
MITSLFWIVPISALLALLFAWIFYKGMIVQEQGTDRMIEIAAYVTEGAMAYLSVSILLLSRFL